VPISRGLKVVLILLAVLFGLGVALVSASYVWWTKNKDQLMAQGKAAQLEGESFGRDHLADACLDEAMSRNASCGGLMCEIRTKLFLSGCLAVSKERPGFCDRVPSSSEIIVSARWALAQCEARHRSDQACPRLLQELQVHCRRGHVPPAR
jgi:hypothetical protein